MLDLVGAFLLTALAVTIIAVFAASSQLRGAARNRLAVVLGAWFVAVVGLGAAGAFTSPALPPGIAIAIALLVSVVAGSFSLARSKGFGIPLETLVVVHAGRLLGVMFLIMLAAGRLPATFANSAGWGDIVTGAAAIPVALAIRRRAAGWRWLTGIWSVVGTLDLVTAVTLGVGSAPGSPVRFIYETPGSAAIATLPLVLIPAFFVPLFLLTHI